MHRFDINSFKIYAYNWLVDQLFIQNNNYEYSSNSIVNKWFSALSVTFLQKKHLQKVDVF